MRDHRSEDDFWPQRLVQQAAYEPDIQGECAFASHLGAGTQSVRAAERIHQRSENDIEEGWFAGRPEIDRTSHAEEEVVNSRTLSRLVRQQFWLFGWDIRRQQGNVLIELGFHRTRNPEGSTSGSTRYHLVTANGDIVTFWGFGVCWSSPDLGSIYLPRLKPRVSWTPALGIVPEYWFTDVADLFSVPSPGRELATSGELTLRLLDWLMEYETVVLQRYGSGYRRDAIAAWRDPIGDPASLLLLWQTLRHQLNGQVELDAALALW